jgi:hypothetical protein
MAEKSRPGLRPWGFVQFRSSGRAPVKQDYCRTGDQRGPVAIRTHPAGGQLMPNKLFLAGRLGRLNWKWGGSEILRFAQRFATSKNLMGGPEPYVGNIIDASMRSLGLELNNMIPC